MTCAQIMPEATYAASSLTPVEIADHTRVSRDAMIYYLKHG